MQPGDQKALGIDHVEDPPEGGNGAGGIDIIGDASFRQGALHFRYMHGIAPDQQQFLFVDHELGIVKQQRLVCEIEQSASMIRVHMGQQYRTDILGVDPGHRQVFLLLAGGVE